MKAKAGLINNVVEAESGTERFNRSPASSDEDMESSYRFSGGGKTSVIKHPVTNVEQSKGAGATKEMMRAEREDYEDEQGAQYLYDKMIRESEEEMNRKKKR